jgi:chromosome segregation ATPase
MQAGEDGMANIPQQLHELLRDALLKLRTLLDLEATVQRQQRQQIGELRAELAEVEASAQQQMASLQQQLQEAQQQQAQLQQQVRDLQQSSEPC